MRRLLPAVIASVALFAACGDGAKVAAPNTANESTASTASTASDVSAAETTTTAALAVTVPTVPTPTVPAECLDLPTTTTEAVPPLPEGKPTVELPSALPTKLVVTDLVDGVGEAAKAGDTVNVNYVGVRSADGTEFDNSYDRGQTFPVTLGAGSVIQGWDEGLIGIKAGGRRQLDIPADLAYGDSPQGDVIQAGDALSFIVDAVSITHSPPAVSVEDKPTVDIPKSSGATELGITDVVKGDKCTIALPGSTASFQLIAYRGDTGAELDSTWETGQPVQISLDDQTIPGLVNGIIGMGVGGERVLVIPPSLGFGDAGNEGLQLPAGVDLILVIDLQQVS